jgi:hypothetical protein
VETVEEEMAQTDPLHPEMQLTELVAAVPALVK